MSTSVGAQQDELEELTTIRFVASALFDVSAEKIARLRAAFEKNQAFYDDIASLYQSVKQTAFERGELPVRPVTTALRTAVVAFTSNKRFYGSINAEVIQTFLQSMRSNAQAEYIVIGRTGKGLMENEPREEKRASYFAFEGDEPNREEIRQFLKNVAPYDQVQVIYPAFVNVFSHTVRVHDITFAPHEKGADDKTPPFDYIFEPELPKILEFFETRVRYLLFQRAMLEAELTRTAVRIFSMNQAQDRSDEEIFRLRRSIRRDEKDFNDLRLLESFSAISRWKKT